MKSVMLCLLFPFYTYASDTHEEVQRDRFQTGPKINVLQPKDFNDTGKTILMNWVGSCMSVVHVGGVPTDRGLAKIFLDMYQDKADKIINDPATLRRANEYNDAYQLSPTAYDTEWGMRQKIAPDVNGGHTFPDAKKSFTHLIHALRAYEFQSIMYNRGDATIVPDGNFMLWYKDSDDPINAPRAFIEFLKQNTEASAYLAPAIRGISILAAYYIQKGF